MNRQRLAGEFLAIGTVMMASLSMVGMAAAQDWPETIGPSSPSGTWNWQTPTMGGVQWWTDVAHFHQWRIQRHALTGHYRLLDPHDIRRAWGDIERCRAGLDAVVRREQLAPVVGTAVILLHGLGRSRRSMDELSQYIEQHTDWHVINMSYASSRDDLDEHALALASVIEHLSEVERIHLVGHSLGNIVVRRYMSGEFCESKEAAPIEARLGRMVMLGPPNQGSELARRLSHHAAFEKLVGPSGDALADDRDWFSARLATPAIEFGIIAGSGLPPAWLDNPWIDGEDDLVVAVAETRLEGAADFLVLPVFHGQMLTNDEVHECTVRFLEHGFFRAPDLRCPIPAR